MAKIKRTQERLKSPKQLNKKYLAAIVLAVTLLGGFLVFQSFASAPTRTSGYADFRNIGGQNIYSKSVSSKDGMICVGTNFDTYNDPVWDVNYKWEIQEYQHGQWSGVVKSKQYSGNNNRDHQCHDKFVTKGRTYRVRFYRTLGRFLHGNYQVYGYKHN